MYTTSNYMTAIPVKDYVEGYRDTEKFVAFCRQCNRYENCWACPPYDFDTDEYILKYESACLIGTKIDIPLSIRTIHNSPEKGKALGAEIIASVRRTLDEWLLGIEVAVPGSRAFFAGTCHVCDADDCTRRQGIPCRHPDKIRPSLEALGFDIGKTTETLLGITLKWSNDGSLPEYLTLVSGLFFNQDIDDIKNYIVDNEIFIL